MAQELEEAAESPTSEEPVTADIWSRALAFIVDGAIVAVPAWISFAVVRPRGPMPFAVLWTAWVGLWVAYHAFGNAQGGATPGKRLLGLRVRTLDGEPLSLRQSSFRAAACLLSWLSFYLGFLWAATNPQRRTWHDLLAGTRVVLLGLNRRTKYALTAVTAACLFLGALGSIQYRQVELIAAAARAVAAVADLEEAYYRTHGGYAQSPADLASLSDDAPAVLEELGQAFAEDSLEITAYPDKVVVKAQARDRQRTMVQAVRMAGAKGSS